ncbi:MAG: FRG domain-containing protein [Pseudomonadales bacterium]|nr:FRG domain-containing protein [Pseudomonadales bacterium]
MARTKRWEWKNVANGVSEVSLTSWKYFGDFVYQEMLDYDAYVWRGHRCSDWKLESTLDRLVRTAKIAPTKAPGFRNKHLEQFKYAARGRRGPNPPVLEDEDHWWALGQHHGLATPLLDWTTSPFVGAFFSFIGEGAPQTVQRAIFALHRPTAERRAREKLTAENARRRDELAALEKGGKPIGILRQAQLAPLSQAELRFIRPLSDENSRLVSQGGLFTRAPPGKDLESWVRESTPTDHKGATLIKVLIPNRDRDLALRNLNRMNINHLSLFPDLYGASKFCNVFSEIDKY